MGFANPLDHCKRFQHVLTMRPPALLLSCTGSLLAYPMSALEGISDDKADFGHGPRGKGLLGPELPGDIGVKLEQLWNLFGRTASKSALSANQKLT